MILSTREGFKKMSKIQKYLVERDKWKSTGKILKTQSKQNNKYIINLKYI